VEEAQLEKVESGLAPVSEGWLVVNVGEAAWITHDVFGARCVFEGSGPVLRSRPDLTGYIFPEVGFTLQVLEPGQPSGMYHAETGQENFLVLSGECLLVVEEDERALRSWDFLHCPPGTRHVFVGAGDGPCVIFMTGARNPGARDRLSAIGGRTDSRRGRRRRDRFGARGLRALPTLAASPPGELEPDAVGLARSVRTTHTLRRSWARRSR
jgi:uncharacterized cupin superfamily protein